MTDDPYNAAERSDVREADKMARAAQRQDLDVTRDIMRTAAGRAYMYRKLAQCCIHQSTFTGNSLTSAFNEGQRNIGLQIEAEILSACPDEFILMLREANERDITGDINRRNRKARNGNGDDATGSNFVDYSADINDAGDEAVEREQ